MQLLAKAKKNSNWQQFYCFRLKRMSENVLLHIHFWFHADTHLGLHGLRLIPSSTTSATSCGLCHSAVRLQDRTSHAWVLFSSNLEVFFFPLLHSFTNMEHDVRDLNRLITSSKAIEYTAGKYFYQSFYTWIINCYNKLIFPHCLSPWLLVWRVKAILSIDCSRKRSMFGGVFWSQHFYFPFLPAV